MLVEKWVFFCVVCKLRIPLYTPLTARSLVSMYLFQMHLFSLKSLPVIFFCLLFYFVTIGWGKGCQRMSFVEQRSCRLLFVHFTLSWPFKRTSYFFFFHFHQLQRLVKRNHCDHHCLTRQYAAFCSLWKWGYKYRLRSNHLIRPASSITAVLGLPLPDAREKVTRCYVGQNVFADESECKDIDQSERWKDGKRP